MNRCCRILLSCFLVTLLAEVSCRRAEASSSNQQSEGQLADIAPSVPRLAGLIPSSELVDELAFPSAETDSSPEPVEDLTATSDDRLWAFPSDNDDGTLQRLPPVDDTPSIQILPNKPATMEDLSEPDGKVEMFQPIASLLPPLPLAGLEQGESENFFAAAEASLEPAAADRAMVEQLLIAEVVKECTAATTGALTDQRINELAKSKIQKAYGMANRSGYYAARQELIEVLRMISHAKDAHQGVPERTEALASGLRALEEAEDFAPRGAQLEADLAIEVICASHRTPIAKQIDFKDVLPHQMMNGYFRYAQLKLAAAVAGEPAGSMALHALGKLAIHLGKVEPEKHRLSQRQAIAFQQAALLAHSQNHLAAHELATLLADAGHFDEAERLLQQVAARDPNAVVLRNLSLMQEKLGHARQAIANRELAAQMAQRGASGTHNVEWLSPQAFSQSGGVAPAPPVSTLPSTVGLSGFPAQHVPPPQSVRR